MNRHQFELLAKQFRGGRIPLAEFADRVCGPMPGRESHGDGGSAVPQSGNVASRAPAPRLPVRSDHSHKGDHGHVLVIAGSRTMPGAAALTALAAAGSGCGLVTVATPSSAQPVVAGFSPVLMTVACPEDASGRLDSNARETIESCLERADVVAIGPGLGISPAVAALVERIYREVRLPVVVDADGLNCLASLAADPGQHAGPRVLTPHPGELRRLLQMPEPASDGHRGEELARLEQAAAGLAESAGVTIVAKSHRSLVTGNGLVWRVDSSCPGLAKAGSGDVLTGIVASLLAQGQVPLEAAVTACALHSLAGHAASRARTAIASIATDLIQHLPDAIREASAAWPPDRGR